MSNRTRAHQEDQLAIFTLAPDQQDVIVPDFESPMTVTDNREQHAPLGIPEHDQEEQLIDVLIALIATEQTARNDRMPSDMRSRQANYASAQAKYGGQAEVMRVTEQARDRALRLEKLAKFSLNSAIEKDALLGDDSVFADFLGSDTDAITDEFNGRYGNDRKPWTRNRRREEIARLKGILPEDAVEFAKEFIARV